MKKIAILASFVVAGCGSHQSSHASSAPGSTASRSSGMTASDNAGANTGANDGGTGYVSGNDNGSAGSMNGTDRQNTAGADATTHDTTSTSGSTAGSTQAGTMGGEKDLLTQVVQSNQMEIDMAKVAKTNAKMAGVKAFAQKALNDHSGFAQKLKPFAQAQGIDTGESSSASSMSSTSSTGATGDMTGAPDMKTRMDHLKTLNGSDFDKEYVSMMVDGHQQMQKLLDQLQSASTDSKLKDRLAEIHTVVNAHLAAAKELQKTIGGPDKQNTRGTDTSGTTR